MRLTGDRNAQRQARLQALQRTAVECQAALLARSGELRKSHSVLPVSGLCVLAMVALITTLIVWCIVP